MQVFRVIFLCSSYEKLTNYNNNVFVLKKSRCAYFYALSAYYNYILFIGTHNAKE